MARAKGEGGLGFRGISEFNTSLLGKHYWRLLNGENTLLGKIFKSRYYPRCSIEESKIGYAPSYAWRSVLSARDLIQKGARWRIGNGKNVLICKDRWISENAGFEVSGRVHGLAEDSLVSSLIDEDLGQWKRDLIFSTFESEEAKRIVSIPLSRQNNVDKLIWHWEKNGEYSVRSAYHLSMHAKVRKSPGPSRPPDSKLWKEIWKAPVNPRIRNFLWRASKNILPTKENLIKKGINLDVGCELCHSSPESVQHLFLGCQFTKQTFFSSILSYRHPMPVEFNDWLLSVLTCGDIFSVQLLCTLTYKVWLARNIQIYQQKASNPIQVAEEALNCVCEFNAWHQDADPVQRHRILQTDFCPGNISILQVDAGVFNDGAVAYGGVIKDAEGNVLLAACKKEEISVSPLVAEIQALRWGLSLATDLHLDRILVQSDCINAVDCINLTSSFAAIDHIATDCRKLLENFNLSAVMFISRACNLDANKLVRIGKLQGSGTWFGGLPTLNPPTIPVVSQPLLF